MYDLTRLLFDDGAERPEVVPRPTGDFRFKCKGVEFIAIIHRDSGKCGGHTLRGWWLPNEALTRISDESLGRDWKSCDYPGWFNSKLIEPDDYNFHAGYFLLEFEPVLGVWPNDGDSESL